MDKIEVKIILEILGRPAQHIKDTLKMLIEGRLSKEKDVKIISFNIKEPLPVQDSNDLFTTFSEISLEVASLETLFGIIFAYMPANVEITRPESIEFTNNELNLLTNKIALRMHDYDAITKKALSERDLALRKLHEVAPHLFKKKEEPQPETPKKKKSKVKKKKS